MGYGVQDLDVFVLQRDKDRLDGTAYFELHPGELPEPMACWLPGSLFVKDAAFDFFVGCFERANSRFDYFAFERFEREQVDLLRQELSNLIPDLTPGCSREALFSRYNSLFGTRIWDGLDTEDLRQAVVRTAEGISSFIEGARAEGQCLWVLGM